VAPGIVEQRDAFARWIPIAPRGRHWCGRYTAAPPRHRLHLGIAESNMNLLIATTAAVPLLGGLPADSAFVPQDPTPAPAPAPAPAGGIPECKDTKKTASGLEYCVLTPGRAEPSPTSSDLCDVHYTGWLLDGTKFDSSRDRGEPASFRANQVIKGWTEGLQLMTPGARFKFTIPAELGYGAQATGAIPPNSTLVFDVELLRVVSTPKYRDGNAAAQKTTESGVKYEVVKAGTGAACGPDDGVALRYALWNPAKELVDCSEWQQNHRLAGTLATLPFPFLRELAAVSKVGDVVRAEVPQKLFPNLNADTVWELELTGISQVPAFRACDPAKIVKTDSGLIYEVIEAGTGAAP
jgi:FKBP-type peptidyl-prolyl cis-trans isomerase